ncbi:two-component sensor histidine kinase [Geobacillus sp. 46C-IIa]|uniref:HAMP domain-containing sensor histidine kinase n=1 Tax=Geobacillus sp. 46C-IIa TaxID=1963025 RepID=UPI0009BEAD50|nr:ATP-binding protein [Geobacillus sp. 46C-IIa]OQP05880.1 two-component sensor histidine kinase [Geobacillus sp. 46C-IIa]QNU29111.1 HAMP domain-containing protein [Geobacillus sp. 46C-IIa]
MKRLRLHRLSLKGKLTVLSAGAIFITYFVFTFLQYHIVRQWLLNEEEKTMEQTVAEIETYYAEKRNVSWEDIRRSRSFLEKLNERYQLIRVTDRDGNVIVSVSNGAAVSLWPSGVPDKLKMDEHFINNEQFLLLRQPLHVGNLSGTIEIARRLTKFQQVTNTMFVIMTVIGLAAMAASALAGRLVAQSFIRPLKTLAKTMADIKNNGLKQRIDVPSARDEIAELMQMFNSMMNEIERSFALQRQFVGDASHELRTPLAILQGHLSLLQRWGKHNPEILEESLEAAVKEAERLKRLVLELLDLSRAEAMEVPKEIAPTDAAAAIGQIVKNFRVLHPDFQFIVDQPEKPLARVAITKHHFEQLLFILLDNAVKYSQRVKKIALSLREEESFVTVAIRDYGIGIPQEELKNVFLRFYRVDKARSREQGGAGLGLSIAKEMIDKYGGQITMESEVGRGTTVKLAIPKAE